MSADNCIFCKILADEIPSAVVYEDDLFRAILDVNPAARGHVIILPKKHAANLFELPDEAEKKGYSTATKAMLDASKLKTLGWNPHVHMEEGLACTVEMVKKNRRSLRIC